MTKKVSRDKMYSNAINRIMHRTPLNYGDNYGEYGNNFILQQVDISPLLNLIFAGQTRVPILENKLRRFK